MIEIYSWIYDMNHNLYVVYSIGGEIARSKTITFTEMPTELFEDLEDFSFPYIQMNYDGQQFEGYLNNGTNEIIKLGKTGNALFITIINQIKNLL